MLWLGRDSHVQALILNTSVRDAWCRLPRDLAVSPAAIRPTGSSPEPPQPGWSPPPTLAGLQIWRRWATDSVGKEFTSVNKCASGGVAEVRIIQLNYHFPTISTWIWCAYCTSVHIIYSNFYGNWTFSISCAWGATRKKVSKLTAFRRG